MRTWSVVFLAAFYVGCSDASTERPVNSGSGSSTTGGTQSGATTGSTSTGNPTGTTSGSGGSTSGTTTGSSTTSGGGSSGSTTTSGSGGNTGATGGKAGSTGSGGSSGTGGSAKDASVETGPPPPPPDPGPLSGGGAGCNDVDPVHAGSATFYDLLSATNVGTCGFRPLPTEPPYWAAMNQARFNNSTDCGACIDATFNGNTKRFIVVDLCPANSTNCERMEHIDMFTTGFNAIGGNGIINSLSWKYVPCTVTGNVQLFIPSTASQFNAPITVRNYRYRIKSVEIVTGMTRTAVMRQPYNAWVLDSTFPPGSVGGNLSPFRIRITDMYGHWIENKVTLVAGQSVDTGLQFPACPAGGDAGP